MKKVYHVNRNHNKALKEQKKELETRYKDFYYLYSDGQKIHFIATEKR